jgi:alpha-mannosidase
VARQADQFNVSLEPVQAGPHAGSLPKTLGLLDLSPADVLLSGLKRAEDRETLVLRIYNPTSRTIRGSLTLLRKPHTVRYLDLNEEPVGGDSPEIDECGVAFEIGPKKIVTMELVFAEEPAG